jgi:thiol:disulfide interchange protein
MGQIVDEAGYQKSLEWLVSKAPKLDDPLIEESAKTNLRKQYDLVSAKVKEYRRGELVAKFPGLKEQYKILGWTYQEMPSQAEQEAPETEAAQTQTNAPTEPEQAPETTPEPPKAKPDLSGWLD